MSKRKKTLLAVAKGGMSQSEIAASLHVSKSAVSEAAQVVRKHALTFGQIDAMDPQAVDDTFFPKEDRGPNPACLQPDTEAFIARKKKNRKLPIKLFWAEHCEQAVREHKLSYSYQTFCALFAKETDRLGATRHFEHEPGTKRHVDRAVDTAHITDKPKSAASSSAPMPLKHSCATSTITASISETSDRSVSSTP